MSEGGRPAPVPTRFAVHLDGHDVTVLRGGTGPPLLYLHGLCDVHAVRSEAPWTSFLARLAAGHDVFAPALPGYDGTTGLELIEDVEDVVWFLADLLTALVAAPHEVVGQTVPVDVVGHSLGGWYAAELALRRPDLVARLVLVSPLGVHVPGAHVPPFFGSVAPRGIGGMGESRRLLFADAHGRQALAALPDTMTEEQQLQWFGGLAGAARLGWKAPHFQSRKLTARLGRVAVPTLVLRGQHDLLVPEAAARAWTAAVAGARLIEVPDAGHCIVLERPETAGEVEGFLGGD